MNNVFALATLYNPEDDYVVKNFALTVEQAEWLRDQAHNRTKALGGRGRVTQAEIVRGLVDHAMQPRSKDGRFKKGKK